MKKQLKKIKKEKVIRIIKWFLAFILIFLALIIIFSTNWTLENYSIENFDQILFTLFSDVGTGSSDLIIEFIKENILIPLGITIVIIIIILFIKHIFRNLEASISIRIRKKTLKINFYKLISYIAVLSLFLYAIYYAMDNLYIFNYIKYSYIESNFLEVSYVDPKDVKLEFPDKKRNLIYIFSESMESTYADKENGGAYDTNYIKELVDLANDKDNINFSSTNLVGGARTAFNATWTMAAMISQTAGVPLKTSFAPNAVESYEDGTLVPGAYSLGQILEDEGYRRYIMVGSDLTFGGRRTYFETHGDYNVFDYYTAIDKGLIDEDYFVHWGYEDEKLFAYAKDELTEIAEDDEPFIFTMLTTNTHSPDGYVDESCDTDHDSPYLNAVACASKELNDFIDWIKDQDFYENTTIILVGDHLSMNTYAFEEIDPNYIRGVYNVYINSLADTDCNKNRKFNTFDYFPTTLAALGVKIEGERLGLGTNLFSCKETLSEQYDYKYINERLREKSLFYDECINNVCE